MEKADVTAKVSQALMMVLRAACFCIFAGRAWQYLMWDAPFRTLLWDQAWMQGIIESLTSMSWEEYTSSLVVDKYIQLSVRVTGGLYAACAVLSLFINRNMKWAGYVLTGGIAALAFLSFLDYKEKAFQLGELIEHAIQLAAPMLLLMTLFTKTRVNKLVLTAKVAVALTFVGHGLYAWGYYPQPGPFIDMLINIFHFSEKFSHNFLRAAAFLDFVAAVLIFVPRASRTALLYCIVWGGLTALARIVAGFDSNFILQSLDQFLFETVFRLSHALLPLWIFYTEGGRLNVKEQLERGLKNTASPAVVK